MAFKVCCSCANDPGYTPGILLRHFRITSLLGSEIGSEHFMWSLDGSYTQRWKAGSATTTAAGTYLFEGLRLDTHAPTVDGDRWNPTYRDGAGFDASTGSTRIAQVKSQLSPLFMGAQNVGVSGGNSMLMTSKIPNQSHASNLAITGLYVPLNEWGFFFPRVRYWRLLENGVPATDILDAYEPAALTTATATPDADVATTDWNRSTGAGTYFSHVDESSADDTDYVWSTGNTESPLTFELSTVKYTGGDGSWIVRVRFRKCDTSGAATSTGTARAIIVLKNGATVMSTTSTPFATSAYQNINVTFDVEKFVSTMDAEAWTITITPDVTSTSPAVGIAVSFVKAEFTAMSRYLVESEPTALWEIKKPLQVGFRKGRRLGYDLWLEVFQNTILPAGYLKAGSDTENSREFEGVGSVAAHGQFGFGVNYNHNFNPQTDTYRLIFIDGTYRPQGANGDDYVFPKNNTSPEQIARTIGCVSYPTLIPPSSYLQLKWTREIPFLTIVHRINATTTNTIEYVPEDSGHAVTLVKYKYSTTSGDIWVNSQTPGGVWNAQGTTRFVRTKDFQVNTANSFTPDTFSDDYPTEIDVIRVKYPQTITEVFDEAGTWTCPADVTQITNLIITAAGGGSGGVDGNSGSATGGGGGGATTFKTTHTVIPLTVYNVNPGIAGTAGAIDGGNGGDGGDGYFDTAATVLAKGGKGSIGATLDDDEIGADGGDAASGIGTTKYSGGRGADGLSTTYGGGGGSAASISANGNNGSGATGGTAPSSLAGAGGNEGVSGSEPGGGGGGVNATSGARAGQPGGSGRIQFSYVTAYP
jgi:hypothetical protein